MKTVSSPLRTLLSGSNTFAMSDLYAFALVGGTTLRYSSSDIDQVWAANLYRSIPIKRSAIREQVGVNVDELTIEVYPGAETVNGSSFVSATRRGLFDGARCTLLRAFAPDWQTPITGVIQRFAGRIAQVEPSRNMVRITVKSDLELLNVQLPRRLYQPGCIHTLFDAGCTLTKASYAATGAASGTPSTTVIPTTLAQADGYFALGTVLFTSGANSGTVRSIKAHASGVLTLAAPLAVTPAAGDTLTAYPGCDKTLSTCTGKFSNKANFRGNPFIPKPETAF